MLTTEIKSINPANWRDADPNIIGLIKVEGFKPLVEVIRSPNGLHTTRPHSGNKLPVSVSLAALDVFKKVFPSTFWGREAARKEQER